MEVENANLIASKDFLHEWRKWRDEPREKWRPDLVGMSEVATCSLWRLATAQRKTSTSSKYRVLMMAGPHSSAGGTLDDVWAAMAFPFAFLGAMGA